MGEGTGRHKVLQSGLTVWGIKCLLEIDTWGGKGPGQRKKPKCNVGPTKLWPTLGRDGKTGVLYPPLLSHLGTALEIV